MHLLDYEAIAHVASSVVFNAEDLVQDVIERVDKTDGERHVLNAGAYDFQQGIDVLRKTFPDTKDIIVEGQTGKYKDLTNYYDGSKATRELDIQYNSFEDVVLSTVNSVKHFY